MMLRKLLGGSVIKRVGNLTVKAVVWILSERTVPRRRGRGVRLWLERISPKARINAVKIKSANYILALLTFKI